MRQSTLITGFTHTAIWLTLCVSLVYLVSPLHALLNDGARIENLYNLACSEQFRGEFKAAEAPYLEAIAGLHEAIPADRDLLALCFNNLGSIRVEQGAFADAAELVGRALTIQRELFGSEDARTAKTLSNFAHIKLMLGDFTTSERLFEQVVQIQRWLLSPTKADLLTTENDLGRLYMLAGRLQEARPLVLDAYLRSRKSEPPSAISSELATTLAAIYRLQGETARAEPLLRFALQTAERIFGPVHASLAPILSEQGQLALGERKYGQAGEKFLRTRSLVASMFPIGSAELGMVDGNLGLVSYGRGDYAQAEALLRSALVAINNGRQTNFPHAATVELNLAQALEKLHKFPEAAQHYRSAIAWYRRNQPANPNLAYAETAFGVFLKAKHHADKPPEIKAAVRAS